ncbi:MAG: hypothetical protein ACOYT8_02295 [Candidatus Dependentiae bacterium]
MIFRINESDRKNILNRYLPYFLLLLIISFLCAGWFVIYYHPLQLKVHTRTAHQQQLLQKYCTTLKRQQAELLPVVPELETATIPELIQEIIEMVDQNNLALISCDLHKKNNLIYHCNLSYHGLIEQSYTMLNNLEQKNIKIKKISMKNSESGSAMHRLIIELQQA